MTTALIYVFILVHLKGVQKFVHQWTSSKPYGIITLIVNV